MPVAKTKALISFAVTAKLICIFVFAYAKSRFSHNEAHLDQLKLYCGYSLMNVVKTCWTKSLGLYNCFVF